MENLRRLAPATAAVLLLYACSIAIVSSGLMARAPEAMAAGVAFDLTLTAAALVYFLAVRPGWLRPWKLVAVVGAGLALARVLLPASAVKTQLLPIAALAAEVATLVLAVRSPFLRTLLRGELEAFAYGLGGWFMRARPARYSFLRGRPWGALVAVFTFLIVVESVVLHVALAAWSSPVAWIVSATSAYALVWIWGDFHALRLGGLELNDAALELRFGLRWRVRVPWTLIADAECSDARVAGADGLSCRVLRTDVQLTLREPIVVHGPFGLRRSVRRLALAVDFPLEFVADVRAHSRLTD